MRLDIRFSSIPVEELWCEAVVIPVIKREQLLSGVIYKLDQKLERHLQGLYKEGFFTGAKCETILIPSEERIKAPRILLKGLGREDEINTDDLPLLIHEMGSIMSRLGVIDWGIHIPEEIDFNAINPDSINISILEMVAEYESVKTDSREDYIKIVFSLPERDISCLKDIKYIIYKSLIPHIQVSVI